MRFIALVLLTLISASAASAQVKAISKEQYDLALKNARAKAETILRRSITEETRYKDRKLVSKDVNTIESFSNDDSRWTLVTTIDGKLADRTQIIYLGKYEYRKEGETPWKKKCYKNCSEEESGGGFGMTGRELPKLEQFLISEATLNGKRSTSYLFYRVYDFGKTLHFYDSRIWIGPTGLILKEENITSEIYPDNQTSVEVTNHEYEPKDILPIKAPID